MGLPVLEVLLASTRSIGVIMTMVSAGFLLARAGLVDSRGVKLLSNISMNCTIPALLFTTVIFCDQCAKQPGCTKCKPLREIIAEGWILVLFPIVVVGMGVILGKMARLGSRCPQDFARGCVAAVTFGNSTGLPIVLLDVLNEALRASGDLTTQQPLLYLSVYLMFYPLLQWSIGTWLLSSTRASQDVESDTCVQGTAATAEAALLDESTPRSRMHAAITRVQAIASAALVPPVVASLLGVVVGLTPIRGIWVDLRGQDNDAWLEWAYNGVRRLGQAAVPINLIVLGGSLSKGPDWRALPVRTGLAIVVSKLLLMPAMALGVVFALSRVVHVGDQSTRLVLWLVALTVTATPTANNVQVMANVAGQSKEAMATAIFVQYMVAPFTLTGWLVLFLTVLQTDWFLPPLPSPRS